MTGEEKIAQIQRQCEAIWEAGREMAISCPYCYRIVQPGQPPCCQLMDIAVRAILERAIAVDETMKCVQRRAFGRMLMGDKFGVN